ncbi:hypothetical protein Pla108_19420 [Botrimarina colliarenosi]|uniref:Carboxypeptidase regulatory-like domain-containing protein n=1 Tax=Botrimarina colliarenosi TaxID=2528001 RepID=A0A5C6AEE0_9BACT|nr:carboxypeptidase-like regulatory domain-containing protein [Botrimarina colliarenosi]TWT97790.1 hypothetical protein Pla108_19420 [Botrimarina colliarenosi]
MNRSVDWRTVSRRAIAPAIAALSLVGVIAAVASWVRPVPTRAFVSCWTEHGASPLLIGHLAAANDRAAFRSMTGFAFEDVSLRSATASTLEQAQPFQAARPRIVYIQAAVTRGPDGAAVLITDQFDHLTGAGGASLDQLLDRLDAEAIPTLLVLDLSWRLQDGQAGLIPCGVDGLVHDRLRKRPLANVLTLVSCSTGETPTNLSCVGRSTFGYFFQNGLAGAADGFGGGVNDGRITAREVSEYAAHRVASWTRTREATQQTPVLYGGADDFLLAGHQCPTLEVLETPTPPEIPEWLLEAWRQRQRWAEGPEQVNVPRLVKRYEAALLLAEQRWREGVEGDQILEQFTADTRPIVGEIRSAQESLPKAPSLFLATVAPAEAPLELAWQTRFASTDPAASAAFAKAVGDAAYEALAQSGVAAVADAGASMPAALTAVADELARRSATPRYVEDAAVRKLAKVSKERSDASPAVLGAFFRTMRLRVETLANSEAVDQLSPWTVAGDNAYRTAWAALLSPGYATVDDAMRYNAEADTAYRRALTHQQVRRRAEAAVRHAQSTLPLLGPMIRLSTDKLALWRRGVATTVELAAAINPVASAELSLGNGGVSIDRSSVEMLTIRLEELLRNLTTPFTGGAVAETAKQVQSGDHKSRALAEAMLLTPLLSAEDRACLLGAIPSRSATDTAELLAFDRESRGTTAVSGMPLPSIDTTLQEEAVTEVALTQGVLRLLGCGWTTVNSKGEEPGFIRLASLRASLTAAYNQDFRARPLVEKTSACRVLRCHPFRSLLDKPGASPTLLLAGQREQNWASLSAKRLADEAADLGGDGFLADAARRLDPEATPPPARITVTDAGDSESLTLDSLSRQQPEALFQLGVKHANANAVEVAVLQPAACLAIETEQAATDGGSEVTLRLRLHPSCTVSQQLATQGVLLSVRCGDSVMLKRIATPAIADVPPVELFVEIGGQRLPWATRIDLPALPKPSTMRLLAINHTTQAVDLDAQIELGGALNGACRLEPQVETVIPLKGVAPPAPAPSWTAVPELEVTLKQGDDELFHSVATLGVADPASFVRVRDARVAVDADASSRLKIVMERLDGAPDALEVAWSIEDLGGGASHAPRAGELASTLTAKNPAAAFGALLPTDPTAPEPLRMVAAINGVTGALDWRSGGPLTAGDTLLSPADRPVIRLSAPALVRSGEPLVATVDVVGAPEGATLEVAVAPLGASVAGTVSQRHETTRRHSVETTGQPVAGAIVLQTSIGAWTDSFATTGQAGRRRVVATVIDRQGNILGYETTDVTIDATPPSRIDLRAVQDVVAGTVGEYHIEAEDDLSGVQAVRLYVGEPGPDGAPPAGVKAVAASPSADDAGVWIAKLPAPATPTFFLSAEATNGVGLSRTTTERLVTTSADQAAVGKVTGAVLEGQLPQPGLVVELRDLKQQPVASTKTEQGGVFHFESVKPGKYLVWAVKTASQRVGVATVDVPAGGETRADLSLSL